MSHLDRSSGKYTSLKSCSAETQVSRCLQNDKNNMDLRLTGSQIHLACRPKLSSGRSSRSSICMRRPMSALPSFGQGTRVAGESERRRPLSADIPYSPGGGQAASSSAPSECEPQKEISKIETKKLSDGMRRKNKLAARFPVFGENNNSHDTDTSTDNFGPTDSAVTDLNEGFGATYVVPTSKLLESLTSEPLDRTWTEAELKECCEELGIENSFISKFEFESLESDCSNDLCHSEKSLGEQIIAMAQEIKMSHTLDSLHLKPRLEGKPPLPQSHKFNTESLNKLKYLDNKYCSDDSNGSTLFSKCDCGCVNGEKEECFSQSSLFLNTFIEEDGGETERRTNLFDARNKRSELFVRAGTIPERELMYSKGHTVNFPHQHSTLTENITNINQSNNGITTTLNMDCFDDESQTELILKYLSEHKLVTDVNFESEQITNLKFQHWFPDSNTVTENSHLSDVERQTDLLLETLAKVQCAFDCSNTCDNFRNKAGISDSLINEQDQELFLECLVEEDVTERDSNEIPVTMRSTDNGRGQAIICNDQNVSANGNSTNGKLQEQNNDIHSDIEKNEEKTTPNQDCGSGHDGGDEKIPTQNLNNISHSTIKEHVESWLNKQLPIRDDNQIELIEKCIPEPTSSAVAVEDKQEIKTVEAKVISPKEDGGLTSSGISTVTPTQSANTVVTRTEVPKVFSATSTVAQTQTINAIVTSTETPKNSTYDDIVSILKVLEEEDSYSSSKPDALNAIPIADNGSSSQLDGIQKDVVTNGKLRDILTFLDEIEHCCDATLESARTQIQAVKDSTNNTELKLTSAPRLDELLKMTALDLAHEVITLSLQLEEKNNSISLLQETLHQQRELTANNVRNADCDYKTRLHVQKEDYEAAVSRHQKFIDQLIADKKCLGDKCGAFVLELKKSEEHHLTTMKTVEERHKIELQKAREMHAAAEKLRRERWIDNKTQKIKEMTVKGLEPELQRINSIHQQELADLRMIHKQELDELELRAARKTTQQMEQLRDQLIAEKEEALIKEKELLRNRIEKQAEQEEMEYQAKRKKLFAEMHQEKERLANEEKRLKKELEEAKQSLSKENARVVERLNRDHQEEIETLNRRYQSELKNLREVLDAEKETWIVNYKREQGMYMNQRESEIREQYKKDRDKGIELVIERLENEASQSRGEMEQAMENRLRRLKEKFVAEIKDLETSELSLKNKYNETKQKLVEKEDEIINMRATMRQIEKELQEAKKITDRLSEERAEVKQVVRKEFEKQISFVEQENIRLREEMAELRVRYELQLSNKSDEVAKIMVDKERQLQQVYDRVKLAVSKKDDAIHKLKSQYEAALDRCCHMEELLDQQRRDYLLK